jgi:hypothetical protein
MSKIQMLVVYVIVTLVSGLSAQAYLSLTAKKPVDVKLTYHHQARIDAGSEESCKVLVESQYRVDGKFHQVIAAIKVETHRPLGFSQENPNANELDVYTTADGGVLIVTHGSRKGKWMLPDLTWKSSGEWLETMQKDFEDQVPELKNTAYIKVYSCNMDVVSKGGGKAYRLTAMPSVYGTNYAFRGPINGYFVMINE